MREFHATPDLAVDEFAPDSHRRSARSGWLTRACLTVYDPEDNASPTLPTIAKVLATQVDAVTGLLVLRTDPRLRIDPAPLRDLPKDLRVSEGASSITYEALERLRRGKE